MSEVVAYGLSGLGGVFCAVMTFRAIRERRRIGQALSFGPALLGASVIWAIFCLTQIVTRIGARS